MNEPSITPQPRPKAWMTIVFVVSGVFICWVISLGVFAWWWLHRPTHIADSPKENRSQPALTTVEAGVDGIELFNGTDLDGWDFDPAVWSVRNGVIYGHQRRSGYGRSLFWQDADLADFELRFRFRLVRGNSGFYYRATRLANFDVGGYEFEIYTNKTGNLADNGTDRPKRRLRQAEATAPALDTEWHEGVIVANGSRLIHRMDGQVLCDVADSDPAAPRTGAIALAMGADTIVEFSKIRLKRIRPAPIKQ